MATQPLDNLNAIHTCLSKEPVEMKLKLTTLEILGQDWRRVKEADMLHVSGKLREAWGQMLKQQLKDSKERMEKKDDKLISRKRRHQEWQ